MKINIDKYYYVTTQNKVNLKVGDFFVQMDDGEGNPFVRRLVSNEVMANTILLDYSKIGYCPYPSCLHRGDKEFKVLHTNKKLIKKQIKN